MKQGWKRMLTAALALMLALVVLPQMLAQAESTTAKKYGIVTKDQVFLRKQPGTSADYWFRMDTNHVGEILGEVTQGGKTWYKVETEHPNNNDRYYIGYVMSDYFRPMTQEETDRWLNGQQPNPTVTPSGSTGGTVTRILGEVTSSGTNFRQTPSMSGEKLMSLERGTIVELTSIPETIDTNHWYGVRYAGLDGYIMSTFIRRLEDSRDTVDGMTVVGYVKLIKNTANLRATPGGEIIVADGWKTMGEVLPYVSNPVTTGGYTWYEVVYGGVRYWVRSDCVEVVTSTGDSVTPSTTASPSMTAAPETVETGYVITTQPGVNMRLQPFGHSFAQIKRGVVVPYRGKINPYTGNNNSSFTWYYVTYNGLSGYIRSDCANPCNPDGSALGTDSTPLPSQTQEPSTGYGYVKMVKTDVALRTTPGGSKQVRLSLGTVVTVTGPTRNASGYVWYPVRTSGGMTGWVRGDCVSPCDANGVIGGTGTTDSTSSPQATATPAPSGNPYGYVMITMDRTNIRASMDGSKIFRVETKGGIYPMWGAQNSKNGKVWYPIIVNGTKGWVVSDCAKLVNADGSDIGSTGPTGSTTQSIYVITVVDNVNLRASASTDAIAEANVALGTVMAYDTTTTAGGSTWYRVIYNNKHVWVRGDCIRIMTQAEYDDWLQKNPGDAPATNVVMGYVKTTASNVHIRDAANGNKTGKQVAAAGTVLEYTEKQTVRNIVWYHIINTDGMRGWLNGNFVVETTSGGTPVATDTPPAPTTPPSGNEYVPPTAGQEATYSNLKLGSTGEAVTKLVTELKMQGYYTGAITSTYTKEVEAAVKSFQKAKGLKVDGIAGPDTQHALFQTVPPGQGSNTEFTFYPAEKIDWYTGGIQQQWPKGSTAKLYDVRTGTVYTARHLWGAKHADAEPLTAADTARICQMWGVTSASQITENKHYQRRPTLILVGNHNYACSVYSVPHDEDSQTIMNNNFEGVFCIHFVNSQIHKSGIVDEDHQKAIEYAYTHAPGGQK